MVEVKRVLALLVLCCPLCGCLTMGAKLEVKRLLEEHEAKFALIATEAARAEATTRSNEVLTERLPGLVASEARDVANLRSVEILESKIPDAVADEFRKAGLTPDFVKNTSEDLGSVKESTEAVDWVKAVMAALTGLIGAWIAKQEFTKRKNGKQ